MQKIIKSYTEQMQADEAVIRERMKLDGTYGRSAAVAHAIDRWAQQIQPDSLPMPANTDNLEKLAEYVEEYVRGAYQGAGVAPKAEMVNLYLKESVVTQLEVIGMYLAQFQDAIPMLLPVLKPGGGRKHGQYNTTLMITLALAREARGSR
jgi:hypothetical protein